MTDVRRATLPGIGRHLSGYVYGDGSPVGAVVASGDLGAWDGAISEDAGRGWSVLALDLAGTTWDLALDDLTRALKFVPGTLTVAGDGLAGCALAVVAAEQRVALSWAIVVDPPAEVMSCARWAASREILGDRLKIIESILEAAFPGRAAG